MEGMAGTPAHRKLAVRLWEHTAHVAALAQVIARRVTHVNPDTAFFAGIIHEVGGFYLIARAGAYPGLLEAAMAACWPGTKAAPPMSDARCSSALARRPR
jgi:HD-like signal output (HDOD) protein